MTENKRFTMCHEQNDIIGWTMSIVDWQTKQPFDYTTYEVHSSSITDTKDEMEDLCLLLNELNDENKELKKEHRKLQLDFNDCCAIINNLKESKLDIEDENEQLKSQREDFKRALAEKDKEIMKLRRENNQMKRVLND